MSAAGQYSVSDLASTPPPASGGGGQYSAADIQPKVGGVVSTLAKSLVGPMTAGKFAQDTASKTAHNMNVENVLSQIDEEHDLDERHSPSDFINQGLHDIPLAALSPMTPFLSRFAKDTWDKLHSGDYSGVAANLLPWVLQAGGGEAGDAAAFAAKQPKEAFSGLSDTPIGAGAKAVAPAVLRNLPVVGKPLTAGYDAFKASRAAYQESQGAQAATAAQAESDARIAAQRASGRVSLADQAGIQPTPQAVAQPITFTPEELAQIKADTQAKITARKQAQPAPTSTQVAPPTPQQPPAVPATPDLRDGIAQGFGLRNYASATADAKARIDSIAARVQPRALPTSVDVSPQAIAAEEQRAVPPATPPVSKSIVPSIQATKPSGTLADALLKSSSLPDLPSPYREAFEGDKGGTLSPQEMQNRQTIALKLTPRLLGEGLKPEDLDTAAGREQAAQIAENTPGLSKNKALINALRNYDPSDTTLDSVQALMSRWDQFSQILGLKSLGDVARTKK